jgi:AsmA-like C-terminal region
MTRRRTWFLRLFAILIVVLVLLEVVISRSVSRQLVMLFEDHVDAKLEFAFAIYVPPYGMHLVNARVIRGGKPFVSVDGLSVALDRFPTPHRQIVIRSIDVSRPIVHIAPGAGPPTTGPVRPRSQQRVSELFRLTRLDIAGGKISYEAAGAAPMVWEDIDVRIDTTQQSDAKYGFALHAGGWEGVSIDGSGSIDVDAVLLDISKLTVRARSEANKPPKSMPPPVQQALRASKMSGEVELSFGGAMSRDAWEVRDLRAEFAFPDAGTLKISGKAAGTWHPVTSWWEAIDHDVEIHAQDLAFWPPNGPQRVEQVNGEPVRIRNGVVTFGHISGVYGSDTFELRSARLDLRELPARVVFREISADLWGGTASAVGHWMFGEEQSYKGRITLRDIDLRKLLTQSRLSGRGFLVAEVQGNTDSLSSLKASGEVEIVDGDFFELPIFSALFEQMKAKQVITAAEAGALFDIDSGVIHLRRAAVSAPVLGLQGGGEIGFDGNVKLEAVATPLADWRANVKKAKIPIVSDVAGEVAGGIQRMVNAVGGTLLYQFRIDGSVKEPQVSTVLVPVLSAQDAEVLGWMLRERTPNDRLVDFLKGQQRPGTSQTSSDRRRVVTP